MYPQPKPKTYRSEKYRKFIRLHPCLMCGNPLTIAHHESLGLGMMGGKCPDSHCVPLCDICHKIYHDMGPRFWEGTDVKMEIIKLLTEYIDKCKL